VVKKRGKNIENPTPRPRTQVGSHMMAGCWPILRLFGRVGAGQDASGELAAGLVVNG